MCHCRGTVCHGATVTARATGSDGDSESDSESNRRYSESESEPESLTSRGTRRSRNLSSGLPWPVPLVVTVENAVTVINSTALRAPGRQHPRTTRVSQEHRRDTSAETITSYIDSTAPAHVNSHHIYARISQQCSNSGLEATRRRPG